LARNIAISDEVYELLRKSKLPGESFSVVIKRSLKTKTRLLDIVGSGALTIADWKAAKAHLLRSEKMTASELKENS